MQIDAIFRNQDRHVRYLLGLYISRKRIEIGLSATDVASQVELSPQAYRRIETGQVKIKASLFEKIQTLLFLETNDLIEIRRISCIKQINDLSRALLGNYPS